MTASWAAEPAIAGRTTSSRLPHPPFPRTRRPFAIQDCSLAERHAHASVARTNRNRGPCGPVPRRRRASPDSAACQSWPQEIAHALLARTVTRPTAQSGRWYLWRALSDGAATVPPPPLITQRAFRPAPGPVADTTAVRHSGDHGRAGATG
jgi:hypothetical protein